jgi:glycosyltransferase involved in cell wall biosynthesis
MNENKLSPVQSWPLVSVVVPTYNCAPFLGEALSSVFEQNYPNLEVIVVDDNSRDDTLGALKAFEGRVTLIRLPQNLGPGAARNRGIAAARGEYLAFLDGDDVWLPGKLRAQIGFLRDHPVCKLVYGRWTRWFSDASGAFPSRTKFVEIAPPEGIDEDGSGNLYTRLLLDPMMHTITVVMAREVIERVGGFDESLRTGEDYDLWLRASRQYSVCKLRRNLALYRLHSQSTTSMPLPVSNEYRVVRSAIDRFGLSGSDGSVLPKTLASRRLARLCFQHGYMHYWSGDACIAARSFYQSLLHFPAQSKALAYAALAGARCAIRGIFATGKSNS